MAGSKENPQTHKNSVVNGESEEKTGDGDHENLWSSLLGEVQTSRSSQLPANKSLLVLGDKESGKTTLIAKLQDFLCPESDDGARFATAKSTAFSTGCLKEVLQGNQLTQNTQNSNWVDGRNEND